MSHISEITERIKNGTSTASSEVEAAFERIEKISAHHAVLSTIKDRARKRAKDIDARLAKGEAMGRLAGVPFIAKDNFLTFESKTTAASRMLENFIAPLQATAIEKLEAEGAICIAKANLDAFAHGGSTENSFFGPTTNAFDESKVAGGSSGGSAVVTALNVVSFALGSDTGGSIRQPAAFNGVVGVKPTYGTVSRYGVVAMASSTDTIGCFTKDVADAELVMSIMSGKDDSDMTTLPDFFVPESAVKP
jgi:aspartyl-tRNA(Asn)/glutamyl-tRNA(Gln) amidotransferase subunit A